MHRWLPLVDLIDLPPGEILSTVLPTGIVHYGLLSDRHLREAPPTIISASKSRGRVVEETPSQFAPNGMIRTHGYWSSLPWEKTIENARLQLGDRYDISENNCEQFVRECHDLPRESPQLVSAIGWTFALGLLGWTFMR